MIKPNCSPQMWYNLHFTLIIFYPDLYLHIISFLRDLRDTNNNSKCVVSPVPDPDTPRWGWATSPPPPWLWCPGCWCWLGLLRTLSCPWPGPASPACWRTSWPAGPGRPQWESGTVVWPSQLSVSVCPSPPVWPPTKLSVSVPVFCTDQRLACWK